VQSRLLTPATGPLEQILRPARRAERALPDTLAVFADGRLLDGIAADGLDDYDLSDILDRLVTRSMITPQPTMVGTR
jgi:hypothetical protein